MTSIDGIKQLDNLIRKFTKESVYNFYLGLARTLLASGTLLTLLFNDEKVLFKSGLHPAWNDTIVPINSINFFKLVPDSYITLTKWVACIILLVIASGWRPRITSIFHWYISACFLNSALDIEGGDQITSNITLMLIPICLMDNRKWHWQNNSNTIGKSHEVPKLIIANTIFLLLKIQVCVIYLHSAVGKLFVPQWLNGTAPYYWFNHPVFGMSPWIKPLINPFVTNSLFAFLISWFVIIFELIMSASILMDRRYYKTLWKMGMVFHFMIIIVHGLFSFFFAMAGALTIYLLIENYNLEKDLNEKV